eukprot:2972055-Alexandrium_andersonii.AAC.1
MSPPGPAPHHQVPGSSGRLGRARGAGRAGRELESCGDFREAGQNTGGPCRARRTSGLFGAGR